jgi:hypothetical protein
MPTPRISILCPSRGRLEPLKLAINSALETASHPDRIEFCIWIDNDDSTYDDFLLHNKVKNIQVIRGQRMWLSIMYNCLAAIAKGEYLMWIGDDSKFCTNGWDKLLTDEIDKFDNQIGLVYVNDLANYEQKYATMGMLHRNWITSFGFLLTPHLRDNGIDGWVTDVARQIGRCKFMEEVHIEHLQYRQGKSIIDKTYQERNSTNLWNDVYGLYRQLKDERRREVLFLKHLWPKIEVSRNHRYTIASFYIFLRKKYFVRNYLEAINYGALSNLSFIRRLILRIIRRNHYKYD